MTGLGIGFKGKRKPEQLWRMDSHDPHARNPNSDAHYVVDGKFHYHIRKAPAR